MAAKSWNETLQIPVKRLLDNPRLYRWIPLIQSTPLICIVAEYKSFAWAWGCILTGVLLNSCAYCGQKPGVNTQEERRVPWWGWSGADVLGAWSVEVGRFPPAIKRRKTTKWKCMYIIWILDLSPIIIPLTRRSSRIFHSWRSMQMNVMVAM